MDMTRRSFLTGLGALIVSPDLIVEPRRRLWPGWSNMPICSPWTPAFGVIESVVSRPTGQDVTIVLNRTFHGPALGRPVGILDPVPRGPIREYERLEITGLPILRYRVGDVVHFGVPEFSAIADRNRTADAAAMFVTLTTGESWQLRRERP